MDKVFFIPAKQSPFKSHDYFFSDDERLEKLELALKDQQGLFVSDVELTRSEPSYSYLTVETFKKENPQAKLFWLLGSDNWQALPKWENFGYLREEIEFLIFNRGDYQVIENPYDIQYSFIKNFDYKISSTEIRKKLQDNQAPSPNG